MKYYRMAEKVTEDSTIIDQRSHDMTQFSTGEKLIDYENDDEQGEPFKGPLICELDDEHISGRMMTFYMDPAIIGTRQFYQDLTEAGLDNIEVHPVIIRDEVNNRSYDDYLLLNVLGAQACAAMEASEYNSLGDNMTIIDKPVLDASKIQHADLFLLAEDTDCIVISEKIYHHLMGKGYTDIWFEELKLV